MIKAIAVFTLILPSVTACAQIPMPVPAVAPISVPAPQSAAAAIDPAQWRTEIAGESSQILTLGSAHLSQMAQVPTPPVLALLIDRLVAFHPDIITHEGVSGEQCEMMRATPAIYGTAVADYCWDESAINASTGLSGPQAREAVEATLASWPEQPTPAQRRRLTMLFLAAADRTSALTQWWQLPESERRTGDGIDAAMLDRLSKSSASMDESNSLAAAVAARLGLNRVYAVDDHSSDAILATLSPACEEAITRMWESPANAALRASRAPIIEAAYTPEGMLAYFRYLNSPDAQRASVDVDFRAAVGGGGAGACGRRYLGWWETRNLRMAANIRAAMSNRPGARVLNIVGASHKPYYDLYLGQMADAVIVDSAAVLGAAP